MGARGLGLGAVAAAVAIAVAVSFTGADLPDPVRVPLGLLLVAAPGCALTAALFPHGSLRRSERYVLAAGLSIASVVLTGLVLNFTRWGLDRSAWGVALGGVTVVASVAAGARGAARRSPSSRSPWRVSGGSLMLYALALLVGIGALGVARASSLVHEHEAHFTQLWVLPETRGQLSTVLRIGVQNREQSRQAYRLRVRGGGGATLYRGRLFSLASGQTRKLTVVVPRRARAGTLEVDLFKAAPPRLYRHVVVWPKT